MKLLAAIFFMSYSCLAFSFPNFPDQSQMTENDDGPSAEWVADHCDAMTAEDCVWKYREATINTSDAKASTPTESNAEQTCKNCQ